MWRSSFALVFVMLAVGCASLFQPNPESTSPEAPRGASDIKSLEKELSSAKKQNASLEARLSGSAMKLEKLTKAVYDLKKKNSGLEVTLERLERENIIKKNFSAPSAPRGKTGAQKPSPGERAVSPPKPGPESIASQKLYNQSYRAVRDGKTGEAIRGFRRFLRLFPESQLAPHSQYWLGEAYYALKQYPQALDEFLNLITRYPKSRKVPDAYYKRGLAYLRRKFPANATLEFEKLLRHFPSHPLSRQARVQLQNLKHFTPQKP